MAEVTRWPVGDVGCVTLYRRVPVEWVQWGLRSRAMPCGPLRNWDHQHCSRLCLAENNSGNGDGGCWCGGGYGWRLHCLWWSATMAAVPQSAALFLVCRPRLPGSSGLCSGLLDRGRGIEEPSTPKIGTLHLFHRFPKLLYNLLSDHSHGAIWTEARLCTLTLFS